MARRDAEIATLHPRRGKRRIGMLLAGAGVLAACFAIRYFWGANSASADPAVAQPSRATASFEAPPQAARASTAGDTAAARVKIVATVNGEDITRAELARQCLSHYGNEVLQRVMRKYLIMQECQQRKISVTQAEVTAEIERMATRFGLPVDQWFKMLKDERGITAEQYANEIIWPTLALRKLAGEQLQVTEAELRKQFEAQYGPAVKARLIVCNDRRKAEWVRSQAVADPDSFGTLAKNESVDVASASANGLIRPIHLHVGHKEVEEVAFQMKEGDISPVITVGNQYAIIKCEGRLPARQVNLEQVKMDLIDTIRDSKMRTVADEIFRDLKEKANVVNLLDDPARRRQMPGVAALINGQRIEDRELAELCVDRHGEEVLEGAINLRLLQQACKQHDITVTDAEIDSEIRRVALLYLAPKADGSPDVGKWLAMVTDEQGISVDVYRTDSVWPSLALKKLVGNTVEVTEEDRRRGYEANFGPRMRCLAIVLNNLRRAQQVWEKARSNPTPEYFGDLAEEYSIEPSSRALRGEVPPIQKYGGQPVLEESVFALADGELSSIIQVGPEQYVIVLCLGRTAPIDVDFAEVREEIQADIYEKKLRLAMAEYFQKLQDGATIDNYLAGTSQSPKRTQTATRPAASPGTVETRR